MQLSFEASEYCANGSFDRHRFEFRGDEDEGWEVLRDGEVVLELGAGFRALKVRRCGVCSTDLARQFLPFPLPQIIGHEVVVEDVDGRRCVVEINASHAARGLATDCAFCNDDLSTHCPDRLVLGIHDLPGGFGPWILAPIESVIPVPDTIDDRAAVLVEPFAAALHAVRIARMVDGDRVAVLGPRRLGMLLVAALDAERRRRGIDVEVVSIARRPELNELARHFGADKGELSDAAGGCDVLFDTTGNPAAFDHALALSRRELHVKSTHGQIAGGITHLTECVVDELAIARWENDSEERSARVAWLASAKPPAWIEASGLTGPDAEELLERCSAFEGLPRVDAVVVDPNPGAIDAAIRPRADREVSPVRPRGTIYLSTGGVREASTLVDAVLDRGLRVSTSRCGDFRAALELLDADRDLQLHISQLITHQVSPLNMSEAFEIARERSCVKAIVEHAG